MQHPEYSKNPLIPVVMCGGSGTRLWPLSRALFPKQFVRLTSPLSLFQEAIQRASYALQAMPQSNASSPIFVVCNEEHRFLVIGQLEDLGMPQAQLLLEPSGRNTAPALTLGALAALEYGQKGRKGHEDDKDHEAMDPVLLVMPADQTIEDNSAFAQAIQKAYEVARSQDTIVTLGIQPSHAETGYGYIEPEGSGSDSSQSSNISNTQANAVRPVVQFVEKPDAQLAQQYFREGKMLWNAGIFVVRASVWTRALAGHRPDILQAVKAAWDKKTSERMPVGLRGAQPIHASASSSASSSSNANKNTDTSANEASHVLISRPQAELFRDVPSESIDYAVMEHCSKGEVSASVVGLNAGWNDLGSWESVWKTLEKDPQGNARLGDALFENSRDCLVSSNGRLVSVVGLEKVVVVETPDAVLVANHSQSQSIKQLVERLGSNQRSERDIHRKVHRPWGWYDSIDEDEGFKVKRILVKPGASLSLQKHARRAEHWVVVRGEARVQVGENEFLLQANQSTYIPKGEVHRLSNPGVEPLEIIEVQSGDYLGEDDIVRLEDVYGRSSS